jgi:hypothetical protein
MTVLAIIREKTLKAKQKAILLSQLLLDKKISVNDLVKFAETANDVDKATCVEALELTTKKDPGIANKKTFQFVTKALTAIGPRVKWESARVIANTVPFFPNELNDTIKNLLDNTEHKGMVVRWSAALALGEIVKLRTKQNKDLLPAIEAILRREEENSIRKIYLAAIKSA